MSKIIPLLTLSLSLSFCGRVKKSEENSNKKLTTSRAGHSYILEAIEVKAEKADEMINSLGSVGIVLAQTHSLGSFNCDLFHDDDSRIVLYGCGETRKLTIENSQKLVEILASVGVPKQFEGLPNELTNVTCKGEGIMQYHREEHLCKVEYVRYLN